MILPTSAKAYEDQLDGLLKSHLQTIAQKGITYNGIDYNAWGKDPRHIKVRDEILAVNPSHLTSRNEKLAYWINAYNILTIDLIIREDERDSIKNLGGIFTSTWQKNTWEIAGEDYSLDNIEHDIIRLLGEPRIHFAINCAAKSCPDLRAEAYRAEKLDSQLEEQTRLTFKNKTKGYKKGEDNSVTVTKVMDWFDEDFNDGNLNSWLANYFLEINNDTDINFFSYDWSLNSQ